MQILVDVGVMPRVVGGGEAGGGAGCAYCTRVFSEYLLGSFEGGDLAL